MTAFSVKFVNTLIYNLIHIIAYSLFGIFKNHTTVNNTCVLSWRICWCKGTVIIQIQNMFCTFIVFCLFHSSPYSCFIHVCLFRPIHMLYYGYWQIVHESKKIINKWKMSNFRHDIALHSSNRGHPGRPRHVSRWNVDHHERTKIGSLSSSRGVLQPHCSEYTLRIRP